MLNIQTGEKKVWMILENLKSQDICNRAKVSFDNSLNTYTLKSFGLDIIVSLTDKEIYSHSPTSDLLLKKLGNYSKLSILWYLVNAKEIPLSGKLVRPEDMRGGQIYLKGSHVLPLDKIADKYGTDIKGFLDRGRELDGESMNYGDASLRIFPFPRIPVTIIMWKGDNEFTSRSDFLFDSTCDLHLPVDIIWSTAMMSVLMML